MLETPEERIVPPLARVALALATVAVCYGAFAPPGHGPPLLPWDKAEHFSAFFVLTLLSMVAFPRTALWRLALALSFAGATIEVIQGLPFVHRDASVKDWLADSIAIAAAMSATLVGHWRSGALTFRSTPLPAPVRQNS